MRSTNVELAVVLVVLSLSIGDWRLPRPAPVLKGPLVSCATLPSVRGFVRATDPPSERWVVTAGLYGDVEPGFEFTVFRGSEYVTTLVIDEVDVHESVGHVKAGTQKHSILDGDECATRL